MRTIIMIGCFACAVLASFAQQNNFIRLQQNKLVDKTGNAIRLNGVNTGGWLLWEGWITGGGFVKESNIKSKLQELMGADEYKRFLQEYYARFITEKDISLMAKQGFNCIRVPLNYRLFQEGNADYENGFAIIDRLLSWSRKYSMYLILDLHAAPGGQSSYFIADPETPDLWSSDKNKAATVSLWKSIAARYKEETNVAGYDLLNEPGAKNIPDLIALYKDIITAIRSVDNNHLLMVEGNQSARIFSGFPASFDDNQIYSFHYYSWLSENNKANAMRAIMKNIPGNRPVWCGEWGEDNKPNLGDVKELLDQSPVICGSAFWTWKRVSYADDKRHPFCSVSVPPAWKKIMSWITWHFAKPDDETATQGINEFLESIRVENCMVKQPYP